MGLGKTPTISVCFFNSLDGNGGSYLTPIRGGKPDEREQIITSIVERFSNTRVASGQDGSALRELPFHVFRIRLRKHSTDDRDDHVLGLLGLLGLLGSDRRRPMQKFSRLDRSQNSFRAYLLSRGTLTSCGTVLDQP